MSMWRRIPGVVIVMAVVGAPVAIFVMTRIGVLGFLRGGWVVLVPFVLPIFLVDQAARGARRKAERRYEAECAYELQAGRTPRERPERHFRRRAFTAGATTLAAVLASYGLVFVALIVVISALSNIKLQSTK